MRKNHIVEVAFSFVLFMMFVLGSFWMLLYGARGYKNGIEKEDIREKTEIPFAYITTRIRQASSIEIEENTILIQNENNITCIYALDDGLYELTVEDKDHIDYSSGTKIYDIDSFEVSKDEDLYVVKLNGSTFKIGVR